MVTSSRCNANANANAKAKAKAKPKPADLPLTHFNMSTVEINAIDVFIDMQKGKAKSLIDLSTGEQVLVTNKMYRSMQRYVFHNFEAACQHGFI